MKDYFTRLFNYDHFVNRLMLGTIIKSGNPEQPVKLMAHILAAQQVWLNRCLALPQINDTVWPDWSITKLEQLIAENSAAWLSYLNGLQADDFDKTIRYKNLKGLDFEDKLSNILAHVINHGTHHRAQIGQHLKAAGVALPMTDYIAYLRYINN